MLYLILINIFLLFSYLNTDIQVRHQLKGNNFVDIEQVLKWDLSPGEKKSLEVVFQIKEGYHIQANQILDENLIPTSITTRSSDEIIVFDPIFPASISFNLKNVKEPIMIFHNKLMINLPIVVKEETEDGIYVVIGNLHYQACDSVKCYFPRDLPFEIEIDVR